MPRTDVGEVVAGPYESIEWDGAPAGHLDLGFRVDPPPVRRPVRPRRRRPLAPPKVPSDDLGRLLEELVLAPDSLSRESVIRVYDHEVQGRTVVKPLQGRVTSPSHGDAAVLQPRPGRPEGLAITTATQPWACREDPREGGQLVVEEAARNLYAVGARPDAFTNCLNFGNPEDPRVLADFAAVTQGMGRAARALGFAVPSGNVSFYNGGLGAEIPPTPVLMATGIVTDIAHAVTSDLKREGDALYLIGRSRPELGGSLWARRTGHARQAVPRADPSGVRSAGEKLLRLGAMGLVRAAHDVSDGGLAVALCEMAFGGGLGFSVDLERTGLAGAGLALVAEGASRWVVEVPHDRAGRLERALGGVPRVRIGSVTDGDGELRWDGRPLASVPLAPLYERWRSGLGIP